MISVILLLNNCIFFFSSLSWYQGFRLVFFKRLYISNHYFLFIFQRVLDSIFIDPLNKQCDLSCC
ncbi:hypothetical protein CW304_21390 [Bacillus sp. UFRGS-B20]|nr:hypothetical protein CW304_21390 [Bacillus sp. UFRGS-B20]